MIRFRQLSCTRTLLAILSNFVVIPLKQSSNSVGKLKLHDMLAHRYAYLYSPVCIKWFICQKYSKTEGWCPDSTGYWIIIPDSRNIRHFQYRSQRIKSPTLNAQIVVANIAVYLEKLLTCWLAWNTSISKLQWRTRRRTINDWRLRAT